MNIERPTPSSEAETTRLIESLSNEEVQFKVVFPEKRVFPPMSEDFSSLTARFPDAIEDIKRVSAELYTRSTTYLQLPMLTDTFTDHTTRRAWQSEKTTDPKIGNIYTPVQVKNKLRLNNITGLLEMREALNLYLSSKSSKTEWSKKDAVLKLLSEFPDLSDYGTIDMETRLQRINQLDRFCNGYINLLSEA